MRWLAIFVSLCLPLCSQFAHIPAAAQRAVGAILQLPEARALLAEIEEEGPVRIEMAPASMGHFSAYWEAERRAIYLHPTCQSLSSQIVSILFEMQNAHSNRRLQGCVDRAYWGQIGRHDYIVAIERIEHDNALRVGHLLRRGVELGIFPNEAQFEVYPHFDDHFALQVRMGHAEWIGKRYDEIRSAG